MSAIYDFFFSPSETSTPEEVINYLNCRCVDGVSEAQAKNIARIAQKVFPVSRVKLFSKFLSLFVEKFSSKKSLIKFRDQYLAEFCKSNPLFALDFQKLNIENAEVRLELAKFYAIKGELEDLVMNVQNFNIIDESERYELARFCMEKNPILTANCIENFGIKNEKYRFDLIISCAKQKLVAALDHIQDFNITSEEERSKLARFWIQQNPAAVVRYFKNFEIENQNECIQLAKLCIEKAPDVVVCHMTNFNIMSEEERGKLAELCIQKNPGDVAQYFKNFAIENQNERIQLAKLCAQKAPNATAYYIANFNITSEEERIQLAEFCLQTNFETARMIEHFNLSPEAACKVISERMKNSPLNPKAWEKFFTYILSIRDPKAQQRLLNSLVTTCLLLMQKLKLEQLGRIEQENLALFAHQLQDPQLYRSLLDTLAQFGANDTACKIFGEKKSGLKLEQKYPYAVLLHVEFALLGAQGVNSGSITAIINQLNDDLYKPFKHLEKFKLMLVALDDLAQADFTKEGKTNVLDNLAKIKNYKEFEKELRCLSGLCRLQKTLLFNDFSKLPSQLLMEKASEILGLKNVPGGIDAFMQTFGASRQPFAVLEYGIAIKSLNDREAQLCLARYVQSVCTGTFEQERYRTDINRHLQKLRQVRPDLLAEWRKGASELLPDEKTAIDTHDPHHLLLCGTEVHSCLRVNGDPEENRGLLGYLMNGGTRLLAVVDSDQVIKARSILRLVFDQKGQPALFLEKLYGSDSYETKIVELAKKRAQQLKLKLWTASIGGRIPSLVSLHSLPGAAPYEYSDGALGLYPQGELVIEGVSLLSEP